MNIRQVIQSDIEESVKKSGFDLSVSVGVTYPAESSFGDYTSNWPLQVSGLLKQKPLEVAKKIQMGMAESEVYLPPEIAAPGFLNFHLKPEFLANHLKLVLAEGERFGSSTLGKDQRVLIEYSSPNIAKPMHVGHLRNTNLGQALVTILRFLGLEVITDNHLGDWGTQFGKLLYAYKNWGKDLANPATDDLLKLYVRFHDEAQNKPELEAKARQEFLHLEQGDKENRALWQKFREISLADFDRLYRELGVSFDHIQGESFYEKDLAKVVDQALESKVATRDPDNSVIVPLEGMPPLLILKSDGATLYGTRDLAAAKYRIEKFGLNKLIILTGVEQSLYFKQVFAAVKKLGWNKGAELTHLTYGLTRLSEGKLSTRSGDTIPAREIIDQAKERATKVVREKDQSTQPDEDLVRDLALGAIKWNDLKISRESEVIFDWQQVFNFEGNSGPYMQYSYARTQNILAKAAPDEKTVGFDPTKLSQEEEKIILRQLVHFPEVVEEAAREFQPHVLCRYAFELAQNFSRFYESHQVLSADSEVRKARLGLVSAVGSTLKISLKLLGINTPSRL